MADSRPLYSNVFTLLLYFALSGTLFFLPFNLIHAQAYSATAAGGAVAPVVVIMFLLSRYTGSLADRFGPRLPLVVGPLVSAAGFVLFAVPGLGAPYWTTFFPAAVVLGVGLAILVPAVTTVALNSVEVRHSGSPPRSTTLSLR
jgi:MFS family permease